MGLERKDRTQFNPCGVGLLKAGLFLAFFFLFKGSACTEKITWLFCLDGQKLTFNVKNCHEFCFVVHNGSTHKSMNFP
jgi:hypothetical protein